MIFITEKSWISLGL